MHEVVVKRTISGTQCSVGLWLSLYSSADHNESVRRERRRQRGGEEEGKTHEEVMRRLEELEREEEGERSSVEGWVWEGRREEHCWGVRWRGRGVVLGGWDCEGEGRGAVLRGEYVRGKGEEQCWGVRGIVLLTNFNYSVNQWPYLKRSPLQYTVTKNLRSWN